MSGAYLMATCSTAISINQGSRGVKEAVWGAELGHGIFGEGDDGQALGGMQCIRGVGFTPRSAPRAPPVSQSHSP